ncbi:MAG: carbohydrate ABC transporter permease [Spirochaetes bacterium]|nr:carbohydrate ABC transporter permease [Spirochaetota bacterium]
MKMLQKVLNLLIKFPIGKLISYIVFISWLLITVIPLIWMMYSSFKSNEELNMNIYSLPHDLFANYNDEFYVIEPQLSVVPDYDYENDLRPRLIIESNTIDVGRHSLVFFLLKEKLPPEVANLQPDDLVYVNQLPFSMRFEINWKTMLFNYRKSIALGGLVFKFFNSIIYAGVSTFFIVLFGLMIGYALSKMRFKKMSVVIMGIIGAGYLISINSVIIPLFLMLSSFHLTDTHIGIILVYTAFGIPLAVMLSSQYISGLPDSLIESAYMDGATPFQTFFKIIMPICAPVILTISIVSSLGIWNEFLLVLIVGSTEFTKSLPVGVYSFSSLTSTQLGWQIAALVVGTAPAMVIYFSFNKYLTKGVVAGSVKE